MSKYDSKSLAAEILNGLPNYHLDPDFRHFFENENDLRFFLCHCGRMADDDSEEMLELLQKHLPNHVVYMDHIDEIIDIVGDDLIGREIK